MSKVLRYIPLALVNTGQWIGFWKGNRGWSDSGVSIWADRRTDQTPAQYAIGGGMLTYKTLSSARAVFRRYPSPQFYAQSPTHSIYVLEAEVEIARDEVDLPSEEWCCDATVLGERIAWVREPRQPLELLAAESK